MNSRIVDLLTSISYLDLLTSRSLDLRSHEHHTEKFLGRRSLDL